MVRGWLGELQQEHTVLWGEKAGRSQGTTLKRGLER